MIGRIHGSPMPPRALSHWSTLAVAPRGMQEETSSASDQAALIPSLSKSNGTGS
jgi:hypothetical protein